MIRNVRKCGYLLVAVGWAGYFPKNKVLRREYQPKIQWYNCTTFNSLIFVLLCKWETPWTHLFLFIEGDVFWCSGNVVLFMKWKSNILLFLIEIRKYWRSMCCCPPLLNMHLAIIVDPFLWCLFLIFYQESSNLRLDERCYFSSVSMDYGFIYLSCLLLLICPFPLLAMFSWQMSFSGGVLAVEILLLGNLRSIDILMWCVTGNLLA